MLFLNTAGTFACGSAVKQEITGTCHGRAKSHINHRMLLQKHCRQDNQKCQNTGTSFQPFFILQLLTLTDSQMNSYGIKYMNTRKYVRGCIHGIKLLYCADEQAIACKNSGTKQLNIRIEP